MKKKIILIVCFVFLLSGCGNDPGLLKGTWQVSGIVQTKVTFRNGETETLGIIDKVSYKVEGNNVLVTYKGGIAKGTTMRYTITGPNTARTQLGTLRRVN